ncbi:aldehyde dehydrogenase family protein [Candidatus Gottesmanbacteria bacterium]|nr:aldehyde dehydrogenase family protein [Candidatus Gottesmanbacteria bacterium]
MKYPSRIYHFINGNEVESTSRKYIEKISPTSGKVVARIEKGTGEDVDSAVTYASDHFFRWAYTPVIQRADILRTAALILQEKREEIAFIVSSETGKSFKDSLVEVSGAIELGFFMAGEGRRFYGRTTTSAVLNRFAYTMRQPIGVCALIVPFNTPIANVSWKAFPALLCGNTCVLKAAKDTPFTPVWFAKILQLAGLPKGVFNVVQGSGEEVGRSLVEDDRVDLVSFTGSCEVGEYIAKVAGGRIAKVSLELGGKNAFLVCDDADMKDAVSYAVLSAFSNAGQRCSSGSRLIIFEKIYDQFKREFVQKTKQLKVGSGDKDDVGPVINESQMNKILVEIDHAVLQGANVIAGGKRLVKGEKKNGFFIEPTIVEGAKVDASISQSELFGPVTCLFKVKNFEEAVRLVNATDYGLTSAIHTRSIHRIQEFIHRVRVGLVSVNGPTFGSEPHLPFGGVGKSGNGHREPGTEALDVYSEWKTVYIKYNPSRV